MTQRAAAWICSSHQYDNAALRNVRRHVNITFLCGYQLDAAVGRPRDGHRRARGNLRRAVPQHRHPPAGGHPPGLARPRDRCRARRPGSGGAQSGLTAAAPQAVATTVRAGFADSLNRILLIGAVIAAIAAITSLTLIRAAQGRDRAGKHVRVVW